MLIIGISISVLIILLVMHAKSSGMFGITRKTADDTATTIVSSVSLFSSEYHNAVLDSERHEVLK
jgi:hypothetical protein